MANFPAAGYLSDAGRTNAEMKVAMEDQLAATKQLPGGLAESTLTIAAGVITPTGGVHTVDTESAAVTDDLATIATTNLPDGSLLWLRCASASRTVVVKHSASLVLKGAADYTLASTAQWLVLKRTGATWEEVSRITGDVAVGALGLSRVVGVVGARATTTTYTLTSAAQIACYNPTSRAVEKIVTSQTSLTCDTGTAGPAANGRDQAAAFTNNQWLYLYYISNPTTDTRATIWSTVAPPTGPTLPSGYTSWAFVMANYWGTGALTATRIRGTHVIFESNGVVALNNGASTTPGTAVSLATIIPPAAICPAYTGYLLAYNTFAGTVTGAFLQHIGTYTHVNVQGWTNNSGIYVPYATWNGDQAVGYNVAAASGSPVTTLSVTSYFVSNGG